MTTAELSLCLGLWFGTVDVLFRFCVSGTSAYMTRNFKCTLKIVGLILQKCRIKLVLHKCHVGFLVLGILSLKFNLLVYGTLSFVLRLFTL